MKTKLFVLFFLLAGFTAFGLSGCASYDSAMGSLFAPAYVMAVSPANGASGISTRVVVKASFNEAMNGLTFNNDTFKLIGPNGQVAGTVYYNSNSLTNYIASFTPSKPLNHDAKYTAVLDEGITGNLNQHIKRYVWSFTTSKK